jgi:creatinine amidohydrolase
MKNPIKWEHLTSPEVKALSEKEAIVLIPVGSIEQHGPHLPLGCDTIIATEMSMKAAEKLSKNSIPSIVSPSLAVCNSTHHMSFAGSMTLTPQSFITVLLEYCRNIASHGFRKIVIVNGHGGNNHPIQTALVAINEELGFPVYQINYYTGLTKEITRSILSTQDSMIHACESETSLMLAIDETLVDPVYKETSGSMSMGTSLEDKGLVSTFHRMESHTENGVMGNSYAATKEKGEKLMAVVVDFLYEALSNEELWNRRV